MLARKATLIIINNIVGTFLGYLALFFIARELGTYPYGIVAFGLGFVSLYGLFADLGFGLTHLKRIPEKLDLGRCIGTYLAVKLVLMALFNAAILTSIYIWTDVFGLGFETPQHLQVIYILLLAFNLETLAQVFLRTFNARLEIAKAQVPRIVTNTIRLILTIGIALTTSSAQAAVYLAWSYVIANSCQVFLTLYFFRGYPVSRPTMEYLKLYAKFAVPLMIVAPANVISSNIDKVMIQFFWTANDVAYYAASQRLMGFILFIPVAIRAVLLPAASKYHSENRISDLARTVLKAERYLLMITLPPVVMILTLPHEIIHILLSDAFLPAAPVLQIVALWALTRVVNVPYRVVIIGMDRPVTIAKITLARAVANVALNLLLIPTTFLGFRLFGLKALGAALATMITQFSTFLTIRYIVWRMIGARCSRKLIIFLYAAACMAMAVWWFNFMVPATRWYHLLTYTVSASAIYLGILYLFRQLGRSDLAFFVNALHPMKMGRYIKKEVRKRGV